MKRRRAGAVLLLAAWLALGCMAPAVQAADEPAAGQPVAEPVVEPQLPPTPDAEVDGPHYPVTLFVPVYEKQHPKQPSLFDIANLEVELGTTPQGYIAPREGVAVTHKKLNEIGGAEPATVYLSAVNHICAQIVRFSNQRQSLIGIRVAPHPEDIDPNDGEDLRPQGQTKLRLLIQIAVVTEMRTLAAGQRIGMEDRVNNPKHQRIIDRSPIQPYAEGDARQNDLLRRDLLDNYLFRLNRHPGRRVDVAISPTVEGTAALDYLITENKPWAVYFQISNTGTEETNELRERFGFNHYQLTNSDDILTLDYITAGFDEVHAVIASYERPLLGSDRVRWRAFGAYTTFTASDVGAADEEFKGDTWYAGGEIAVNVLQIHDFFLDLVGGATYEHVSVDNSILGTEGDTGFFYPHIGARAERVADRSTTLASVLLKFNIADIADTEVDQLSLLGRPGVDEDDWVILEYDASHSFFIEPLLFPRQWANPESALATLAHEIYLGIRGQYGFNERLIPNFQRVAGGLYTVRGYEESEVAGDSVVIGTVEYRFHIPRAFAVAENPRTLKIPLLGRMRLQPGQPYGRPDWDLVFAAFVDAAHVDNSGNFAGEGSDTLVGTGIGVELVIMQNLIARVDWGIALHEAGETDAGDSRVHFVVTLRY